MRHAGCTRSCGEVHGTQHCQWQGLYRDPGRVGRVWDPSDANLPVNRHDLSPNLSEHQFNDPPGSRNRRKLDTPGGFDSEEPTLNETALGASARSPRVGLSSSSFPEISS